MCVCVCVFFEGGGALHPLMNMFNFGSKRHGILLLGASQCHVYGWRTGPVWCATFYLKVRRFPGELLSPIILDFLWFAINFAHHHFIWIPDSTKWSEANVTYSYTETWLFMVMLILCSIGKKYTKVCSFLYFQFAKWVPPKSEFSRRLSKTCQYWSCWKPLLKWRLWNVKNGKKCQGVTCLLARNTWICISKNFGPLQVLDGASQIDWILMALITLRHMKCAHDILPMKSQQWCHRWNDLILNTRECKKNLYRPPLRDFLSLKLLPWPLRSFQVGGLSLSLLCSKGMQRLPKEKIKNPFEFMIHDSWCKFPSPNRKYIHHSWYCCMSSVCTFLLFLPLQDGPENSVSKVPLDAGFRKMQLALNGYETY